MAFQTEQELVNTAIEHLPFRRWLRAPKDATVFQQTEVQGLFGIPDLLAAVENRSRRKTSPVRSIAFEMKLSNWRRGLMQAFRYRTFACKSVLVIDNARSAPAVANLDRFIRANIGLVGLNSDGSFHVYAWPEPEPPFNPELQAALTTMIQNAPPAGNDRVQA